tara:strand:+ start:293 stop:976 length:684 start_codon:yes stop_codon:yes gene_type:complete
MISKIYSQLDLLQKRREASNSNKITFSQLKQLRKKGFLIGLMISGLGVTICAWTGYQSFSRIKYKEKLEIEAREYELLKNKYNSILTNLKSIYKVNTQIAQGIIGTKSGSALLLELTKKLPITVQLISIKSKGKALTLQGRANQPSALSSIESVKLKLSDSFLIKDKSVSLSRAWESKNKKGNYLNFTLKLRFNNPSSDELLDNYKSLGSFGLYRRVNLLKQEGLIK